ncbi:16S rRNA (guanine(966)-N(2))-methyltransferase RsmD [Chloroflexota bacterium]|nr:16S rRNA (guanine(966)-N(2))-methyltransferase RsmD [Chloroflexota bacterium]
MRVISGYAKGITLASVPGKSTRPITDRVKEALFNILSDKVLDTTWLDLFGGTGAVGIEALSRDAESVVFIEINYQAYKTILQNLKATDMADYATVRKMDAFTYLNGTPDQAFDVIYNAPPQYQGIWLKTMEALDENPGWLAQSGIIIAQIHPKEYQDDLDYTNFEEFDQRNYGDTRLVFYRRRSME